MIKTSPSALADIAYRDNLGFKQNPFPKDSKEHETFAWRMLALYTAELKNLRRNGGYKLCL
jgi:hypothetical protein